MLESSFEYIIIRTLPESILFMLAGFILLNLKIDKIKLLVYGLLLGGIVTAIRSLPIAYGIHTVLAMMIGGYILTKISKLPLAQVVMATCGIFISLALSEGIYIGIATGIIGIPMEILTDTDAIAALCTLPSLIIFIGIVILMKYFVNKISAKQSVNK